MCGRYASSRKPEDLIEEFEVDHSMVKESLEPDYNVAPTKDVYAVMDRVPRDAPKDTAPERRLTTVRWGLVPSWAKDISIGNRMINARVETLGEKPAFKRALARRRCLLPADGYFEWYPTQQRGKSGKPLKQPFFIRPADGRVMAMAGLYEIWRNNEVAEDAPGAFVWSATVITTSAEDSLGHIHDRMPMIVEPERYSAWLDATVDDPGDLASLLVPAAPGRLKAYPVATDVNNVRNNGPSLVEPLAIEGLEAVSATEAS
jgi:putative SOS response-associated peptidase YedK